jgi:hypothetical protein
MFRGCFLEKTVPRKPNIRGVFTGLLEDVFQGSWDRLRLGCVRAFDESLEHPEKAIKFFRDLADALEARQRMKEVMRGTEPTAKKAGGHGQPAG